jgi:hypothetical protein
MRPFRISSDLLLLRLVMSRSSGWHQQAGEAWCWQVVLP